ncbi:STAS domain-containing protein [Streptomyces violaceus]
MQVETLEELLFPGVRLSALGDNGHVCSRGRPLTRGPWSRDAGGMDGHPATQPGERLRVCSETVDRRTVVTVVGEVDHLTADRLSEELESAVINGARSIEADFSRVAFCDCSGLSVLLAAHGHCRDAGALFAVSGPMTPVVKRLLQLTGTGPVLLTRAA